MFNNITPKSFYNFIIKSFNEIVTLNYYKKDYNLINKTMRMTINDFVFI